jgi:hypothetical protein
MLLTDLALFVALQPEKRHRCRNQPTENFAHDITSIGWELANRPPQPTSGATLDGLSHREASPSCASSS